MHNIYDFCNVIRGFYGPSEYQNVFFPLLLLKVCEENTYIKNSEKLKDIVGNDENTQQKIVQYIEKLPNEIREIFSFLNFESELDKLSKNHILDETLKKFFNLKIEKLDSQSLKNCFEEIIYQFFTKPEAGDHYTSREVVEMMVKILIHDNPKIKYNQELNILDMAAGTGGMLSCFYDLITKINQNKQINLFAQEINRNSYAICYLDLYIRQTINNHVVLQDSIKEDAFSETQMDFVIANPPFGQSWGGSNGGNSLYESVKENHKNQRRFKYGIPSVSDMQWLFIQHGIEKLKKDGKAAIICSASVLQSGGITSGESQIRKAIIDEDKLEAIVALPYNLFYNTGIQIYVLFFNNQKSIERKNKIQIINASEFYVSMKKALRNKRVEITKDQIEEIVDIYHSFQENEYCKIIDKENFIYQEYTIYQKQKMENFSFLNSVERIEDPTYFDKHEKHFEEKIKPVLKHVYTKLQIENLGIKNTKTGSKFNVSKFFIKEEQTESLNKLEQQIEECFASIDDLYKKLFED